MAVGRGPSSCCSLFSHAISTVLALSSPSPCLPCSARYNRGRTPCLHLRLAHLPCPACLSAHAELTEFDAIGLDEERLATLQKGIQRFAALARFG